MSGLNTGDRVILKRSLSRGAPPVGTHGTVIVAHDHFHKTIPISHGVSWDGWAEGHNCGNLLKDNSGWYVPASCLDRLEEEEEVMATEGVKNIKNFKNGDIISVKDMSVNPEQIFQVFAKFGDMYYNLSKDGQMKGFKYLPRGEKRVLTNLSGLGEYFLRDIDELEEVEDVDAAAPF